MTGRWLVRRGRVFWWAESPDASFANPFTTWHDAYTYAYCQARGVTT